jgi:hypothetical protein
VFENEMLRIIFGPKKDEVTGSWIKLVSDELYNFYCSQYITVIKSRTMGWEGYAART